MPPVPAHPEVSVRHHPVPLVRLDHRPTSADDTDRRRTSPPIGADPGAALRDPSGQATAEYALVLLGAAAVALMLTAWATKSGAIGELFDAVVEQLQAKAR
jgi:Flp pilus assembly pilin Flp